MDWKMVVDTILANPALWWPVATGGLSLVIGFLAKRAPAIHEILSALSVEPARFLNGLRMLFDKSRLPLPKALPPSVSEPKA